MIASHQLVFLLDGRAGLHARLIQVDLLLNVFLLLRAFLDYLVVLVNLGAQLQDLSRFGQRFCRLVDCRALLLLIFLGDLLSAVAAMSFFALITSG